MAIFCPNEVVWGNVATWFAGLMTLGAVIAAFYLPLRERRARDKERLIVEKVNADLLWYEADDIVRLVREIQSTKLLNHMKDPMRGTAQFASFANALLRASERTQRLIPSLDSARAARVAELVGLVGRAAVEFQRYAALRSEIEWDLFRSDLDITLHHIIKLGEQCWHGVPPETWLKQQKHSSETHKIINAKKQKA